jgi:hypothetical protein
LVPLGSACEGLYLHNITVVQMEMFAQLNIRRDLDDRPRMMTASLFIRIRTQNESASSLDRARNDVHRNAAAVFPPFKPNAPSFNSMKKIGVIAAQRCLQNFMQLYQSISHAPNAGAEIGLLRRQ